MNVYEPTGFSYTTPINPTAGQWIAMPHDLSGNTLQFFRDLIAYKMNRCDVIGYQDPLSGDYKIFDVNASGSTSQISADLQYVPPAGTPLFVKLISSGDNPSGNSVPLPISGNFYPFLSHNIQQWMPSGIGTWIQLPPVTTASYVSDLASATPGVTGVQDIIWLQNGEEQRWPNIDATLNPGIGYCIRTSEPVSFEHILTVPD